jgi:hypothetical protein
VKVTAILRLREYINRSLGYHNSQVWQGFLRRREACIVNVSFSVSHGLCTGMAGYFWVQRSSSPNTFAFQKKYFLKKKNFHED